MQLAVISRKNFDMRKLTGFHFRFHQIAHIKKIPWNQRTIIINSSVSEEETLYDK
jgi:hypothetical protein